MGILDRILNKAAKAIPNSSPVLSALVTMRDRTRTEYAQNVAALELAKLAHGLPGICAHILADCASQQPLRLYRAGSNITVTQGKRVSNRKARYLADARKVGYKAATWAGSGGNVAEVADHPVLDLLSRPNSVQIGSEFAYQRFWWWAIAGEMFAAVVGRDQPSSLWPLLPPFTNPIPEDDPAADRLVRAYAYGRERSAIETFDAEDVLHFKFRPHPSDPYHGYGPLHVCYRAAQIVAENEGYDLEFIESGNMPLLFVSLDPKLYGSPTAMKEAEEHFRKATKGIRGKTRAYFGGGMTVTAPPANARELQTVEKVAQHKATIRQSFGIPETVLDNKSSAFASAAAGDEQFWGGTIRPLLARDAEQLTELLLPMFGIEPGEMFFAYDDPVMEDLEAETRVYAAQIATGILSINEAREELNRSRVEGGDVYAINGVPLGQLGQAPAPLLTLNDNREHEVKVVSEHREPPPVEALPEPEHEPEPEPVLKSWLDDCHAGPDRYAECPGCGIATKDDDDDRFVNQLVVPARVIGEEQAALQTAALRTAMASMGDVVERFFRQAQERAASQIASGVPINLSELQADLERTIGPTFEEMFRSGFDFGALELGEDPTIDPFSIPNAEAILEAQTSLIRQLSKDITDHAAQSIELRVRNGIESGEPIAEIAKGIEEDTQFSRVRAERIARTEVQQAQNAGKRARYKEAGVTKVYWVNAPGATAVHRAIAGLYPEGQDIDKPFVRAGTTITAGGESESFSRDIYHPPARPNCRCSIQARRNDIEEPGPDSVEVSGDE